MNFNAAHLFFGVINKFDFVFGFMFAGGKKITFVRLISPTPGQRDNMYRVT